MVVLLYSSLFTIMVADKQTNIHTYKQQNKLHTEINKKHKKDIAYVRLNDKQLYHKSYHKYIITNVLLILAVNEFRKSVNI